LPFARLEFELGPLELQCRWLEFVKETLEFEFQPREFESESPGLQLRPLELGNEAQEFEFQRLESELDSLETELEPFSPTPDPLRIAAGPFRGWR